MKGIRMDTPFIQCTRTEFESLKNDRETLYTLADFAITTRALRKIFDYEQRHELFHHMNRSIIHTYGDSAFGMILLNILHEGDCVYYHDCDECNNAVSVLSIACMITDENVYENLRICTRCPI